MSAVATKQAVSVDAKDFAQAVASVAAYASNRTPQAILKTVHVKASGGSMRLEACNGEGWVSRTIQSDGEIDVCLREDTLSRASKAIQANGAEIVADGNDNATLTSGRARFRLPGLEAQDFPTFPKWEGEDEPIRLRRAELSALLRGPLMAVYTGTGNAALTGVSFKRDGDDLVAAAYDIVRLHVARGPVSGGDLSGIVPAPILKGIESMSAQDVEVRRLPLEARQRNIEGAEGRWMARCGDTELVHAPLYGKFPDWERKTPFDAPLRATLPRDAFAAAVQRVCGTVSPEASRVEVQLEGDAARIFASGAEKGDAEDFVAGDVRESLRFAANYRFLIDAAASLSGEKIEVFSMGTALPILFRGEGPNFALVMPMHLA